MGWGWSSLFIVKMSTNCWRWSADGGGVRGYSMLLLLQEVMHKLFYEMEGRAPARWEVPRPCDHFDLIGGTGTGGYVQHPAQISGI